MGIDERYGEEMRLWHQSLIPKLPRAQLLGQHRECCALRGNGWGKKHSTVDYVFKYPMEYLVAFHQIVMKEMELRGYDVSEEWLYVMYRGKKCESNYNIKSEDVYRIMHISPIYPEHNDEYLRECIENLKGKGVEIE